MKFTIEIEPKGKERPRFGKGGKVYTPRMTQAFERFVKIGFQAEYPFNEPVEAKVPLVVYIKATYAMPLKMSKVKKARTDGTPCCKVPDADNVAKAVCDALNGVAYNDDNQIVRLVVDKVWGYTGEIYVEINLFME